MPSFSRRTRLGNNQMNERKAPEANHRVSLPFRALSRDGVFEPLEVQHKHLWQPPQFELLHCTRHVLLCQRTYNWNESSSSLRRRAAKQNAVDGAE